MNIGTPQFSSAIRRERRTILINLLIALDTIRDGGNDATVSASVSASLIRRGDVGEIGNGTVEFC
ncbi:hypothetical protein [Nostoc sp.]|uniref:hypothetical protein n=1 Tax=Nostoc sp. TaxID=1180 RepID=UPI002FFA2857